MARKQKSKPYKKGKRTALYPNGWPGNLRAVLYLNSTAREARKEES